MSKEYLQDCLEDYDKAVAEAQKVRDNAPEADEHGQWPRWYVGSVLESEKTMNDRLARLGRFVLDYREQMLELVPTEDELLDMELADAPDN